LLLGVGQELADLDLVEDRGHSHIHTCRVFYLQVVYTLICFIVPSPSTVLDKAFG
jgi:hypothetical protein